MFGDVARLSGPPARYGFFEDHGNSIAAAGGVETIPRFGLGSLTGVSGQLWLSYFTSQVTGPITKLMVSTGTTAAVTCTFARVGLFTAAADDSVTLVARTDSDTTIGAAGFSPYERSLSTTGGYPASYTVVTGRRYAIGFLQLAATPCDLVGMFITDGGVAPVPSRIIGSQTDIATSYAVGTIPSHFQAAYFRGRP